MRNATHEPGLFVSRMVPVGNAYVMDMGAVWLVGPGGTERCIALHPDDWNRLTPAQQEMVRECMVRRSAEDGLRALGRFLNVNARPAPGGTDDGGQTRG